MGEQDTAGTPLQESRPDTGAAFLLSGLFHPSRSRSGPAAHIRHIASSYGRVVNLAARQRRAAR